MSIKNKLIVLIISIIMIFISLATFNYIQTKNLLVDQLHANGSNLVQDIGETVDYYFYEAESILRNISFSVEQIISNKQNITDDELEQYLIYYYKQNKHRHIQTVFFGFESTGKFSDGTQWKEPDDYDARIRPWYMLAKEQRKIIVTEPYVDAITNTMIVSLAMPVYHNKNLVGVLGIDISLQELQKISDTMNIYTYGYGVLLLNDGTVLTHPIKEIILKENISKNSNMIPSVLVENSVHILSGNNGYVTYDFNNQERLTFYSTNDYGFRIMFVFPIDEFNSIIYSIVFKQIIFSFFCLILIVILVVPIIVTLNRSLSRISKILSKIATLDFTDNVEVETLLKTKGEMKALTLLLMDMEKKLIEFIIVLQTDMLHVNDSSQNLAALAEEFNASFDEISKAVSNINNSVEDNSASLEEMTAGIEEVSSGSQSMLSQVQKGLAATEKTNSNILLSVDKVKEMIQSIFDVGTKAKQSLTAIQELEKVVSEISKFVNVISSIADQTNLLSLNASIEAARAGEAGRGFAVVADEVRKLAESSSNASKEVSTLINSLISTTKDNIKITEESDSIVTTVVKEAQTVESMLQDNVKELQQVIKSITDTAGIAENQTASSEEMAAAIEAISHKVQDTSESAQEVQSQIREVTTASNKVTEGSEQLAQLATKLQKLMEQFKLS